MYMFFLNPATLPAEILGGALFFLFCSSGIPTLLSIPVERVTSSYQPAHVSPFH